MSTNKVFASAVAICVIAVAGIAVAGQSSSARGHSGQRSHRRGHAPKAQSMVAGVSPGLLNAYGNMAVGPVVYEGDGVQEHPLVYLIFWGPQWTEDTSGIIPAEEQLFKELGGSQYGAILGQYGVADDTTLGGIFIDPRAPAPGKLNYREIALEAARAAAVGGWKDTADTQWVVLPQTGTDMSNFSQECGEHDDLQVGSDHYVIDLIPSFRDPQFGNPCVYDYSQWGADSNGHTYSVPGAAVIAATTALTSHEWAEAATDPSAAGGWQSQANITEAEVADLCYANSDVPPGMTVNVTYLWSNALGSSEDGCTI
jgi:hypothetical protein